MSTNSRCSSTHEASAGLVPAASAVHFWGWEGGFAMLVMLFMAVTSTGSAELIAVSSIFVYDIYHVYINPDASGEEILKWSRVTIVVFGLSMGIFSLLLNAMGLSLGWVYLFMGIMIGSAVAPISYLLLWKKCTARAAISGATLGWILATLSWLLAAKIYDPSGKGEITLKSTGEQSAMLIGNVVAIFSSFIITTSMSLLDPDDYDFQGTRAIPLIEEDLAPAAETEVDLRKAKKWMIVAGLSFTIIIVVLWPLATIPAGNFTKTYFSWWVYLSVGWAFVATIVIIALPLWESWNDIKIVLKGILTCKNAGPEESAEEYSEVQGGEIYMELN